MHNLIRCISLSKLVFPCSFQVACRPETTLSSGDGLQDGISLNIVDEDMVQYFILYCISGCINGFLEICEEA